MNWTGGRLRRQSHNRPDSTLKIQKQHFARARLKQREAYSKARLASAVRPSFAFCSGDTSESPRRSIRNQQRTQFDHPIRPSFDLSESHQVYQGHLKIADELSEANAKSLERDPRIHYIDFLKQYLLGKKDWVGLSPTRPLKMNFTPTNEKERIGKRRRLSKDEEVRSTAIAKSNPTFTHMPPHGVDTQLHHTANDILNWGMEIHISTPKKIGQFYEIPGLSNRPRSASSDSMLSDVGEQHEFSLRNVLSAEKSHIMKLGTQHKLPLDQEPNKLRHSDQLRQCVDKTACSSKEEISNALPATRAEQRTSPTPVLHRFTLDDQVLAERMANSEREDESSPVHLSDHRDFYLNRNLPDQQDVSDEYETLLSFSVKSKTDDRYTNISSSHESNPTDTEVLPQTQKIARKLPPSQPHLPADIYSETPTRYMTTVHDISVTKNRPTHRRISINNDTKRSPTMLFGQEVHPMPPDQTGTETTFRFPRSTIRKNLLLPNIHSHKRPLPPTQPNNTPTTRSRVGVYRAATMTKTPRPVLKFRFPSHWTPHRNIQHYSYTDNTDQNTAFPDSAFVTPLPRPSHLIDILSKGGDQHGRQSAGALGDEGRVIAPVFNTPFRRHQ